MPFKVQNLFQVQQDLKTEQEMPIKGAKKMAGLPKGGQEEDKEILFPKDASQQIKRQRDKDFNEKKKKRDKCRAYLKQI